MDDYYFPRPLLAQDMADNLQGKIIFSNARNGLFLAAPRRTGKSTFLQFELKPTLEERDIVVIYVDLWSDQGQNPSDLISQSIGNELSKHLQLIPKVVKATGLESLTVAGVKIDPTKIGKPDGVTLTDALRGVLQSSKKRVALIIDEAQHALTTTEGEIAMAALKSARDQLNTPHTVNLMLVMSGSDRDKLLRLVNNNAAPFFGSSIHLMPLLDRDFIDHISSIIESQLPSLGPVDTEKLWEAFELFGHRPELFVSALIEKTNPLKLPNPGFEKEICVAAKQHQEQSEREITSAYIALKPVEQAILWRLCEQKGRFRPYDAESLRFYTEKTGSKVSTQKAQKAMESLRVQTPSFIWKSARGEYTLNELMMHQWFEKRIKANEWPPTRKEEYGLE
jgi:hypothetical protein